MILFMALLRLSFLKTFQYRGYVFINLISTGIQVFVQISLWLALFTANSVVQETTLNDMINYLALTGLLALTKLEGPGQLLSQRIINGSIAIDLIRPYKLKSCLLSQSIGENLARFLLFVFPVYTVVLAIFGLQLPTSPLHTLVFFHAVLNGAIISFYYFYLVGMLPFWLQSTWYVRFVNYAAFTLFGGAFVPIWFYPETLVKISYFLPFRYVTYEAVTFYLGRTSLVAMMGVLATQLVWIGILAALEAFVWKAAQKKIMIFGG
jgi:ABC-2 type transport system permease protein